MGRSRSTRILPEIEHALRKWEEQDQETNSLNIQRLRKNLSVAIQDELTERQQQMLLMSLSGGLLQTDIARELGVDRSTVSRTLKRAMARLEKVLKYSL